VTLVEQQTDKQQTVKGDRRIFMCFGVAEVDKYAYILSAEANTRLGTYHHHSRKDSDYRQQYPLLASVRNIGHLNIHNRAEALRK